MIDRGNILPLTRQASLLRLSRSSVYYLPRPVPPARLVIMRRIDELHLEYPFAGSRMLRDLLRREGITIGRLAVATLMRRMSIEALYRRSNTSKPAPCHKIYLYLLSRLVVDRPNQVWAPGLGDGHHRHPDGAGLCLLGGGGGLVQPAGAGVEVIDHTGDGVLSRRRE